MGLIENCVYSGIRSTWQFDRENDDTSMEFEVPCSETNSYTAYGAGLMNGVKRELLEYPVKHL
jgi:hypothetical protein